ncbi:hypothetical protein LEP1GSC058_2508 [Leptospira fainei serovar Hurstbridge str. BUT 6]|uniref:Phage holin family protein n=1 Tax=Leptospira fainei serovar Hurstbridge str. BUT 6 TaxID=1193011 RepID=S3UZ75_9LEPT|nr:phage holin family protein [Leptospira fainei]EPG73654.1 hypothetical protein LEP1GSC058_2508 [Leptospira fainei serovar Hurstbridge str. BUT 6]
MARLLLSLALQSLVILYVFPLINPLFRLSGSFWDALIIALFFGFLNFVLRWFLVIFTLGLGYLVYILTLGLAGLIVNAVVLLVIGDIFPGKIFVPSFFSAFLGGAVLALANYVAKREASDEDSTRNRT